MSPVTDPVLEPWQFEPDPRSAFGPIVSAFEVEHALGTCVRRWQRDYLGEVARQRGLPGNQYPPYRSLVLTADELEKFPEDQLPALVVLSPGLVPGDRGTETHGDGTYDGRLEIECRSVVSARGNREAGKLARLYTAGIRSLCVQQALEPQGGLTFRRVDWTGERFDRPAPDGDRTQAVGIAQLAVEVVGMVNWREGPLEPLGPNPPPETGEPEPERLEWPLARRTQITISKEGD